jgi:hypothetical protein
MRSFVILVLLGGCALYGHQPECETPVMSPEPLMLVNPETLACQSFGQPTPCNSVCGPCLTSGIAFPTWGRCDDPCRNLDESTCAAAPTCRVAREWSAYYGGGNSFIACYPLDQTFDELAPCKGLAAQGCSEHAGCTALYELPKCDSLQCNDAAFKECIPEVQVAGTCTGTTFCDIVSPTCPTGTTPGVANGCYTGSCIPNALCH